MPGAEHKFVVPRGPIPAAAGIGLRTAHQWEAVESKPAVAFLEVHSENYFSEGGPHLDALTRLRGHYPLSIHGVGLSLGSTDPLDAKHLGKLKRMVERFEPALVSEHLSWGSAGGRFVNDLLPLPYTMEALRVMRERVDAVQAALGRRILIENISAYVQFGHDEMDECEFLNELSRHTGCGVLLDINNLFVNQCNHGTDAFGCIDGLNAHAVQEIHLAGHSIHRVDDADIVIDTHSAPVCDPVWRLYDYALDRIGVRPTLIEWDTDLPTLAVLVGEAHKADAHLRSRRARAA